MPNLSFTAGTKLAEFVTSSNDFDVIEGPLGSGKTVGACARIMRHAQEQVKSPIDGFRKTRFAVVRNTHPDLKRTTIRTWLDCFPETLHGRFNWGQALTHKIAFGDVRLEVDFMALDRPEDVRRLRSGEYTGIYFNELQYIIKELVDEATSRLRYPKQEDGGPTWRGVLADMNAPDEDHWTAKITGRVDKPAGLTDEERVEYEWPDGWGYFLQPPALLEHWDDRHEHVTGYSVNPDADNLTNLPSDYYQKQIKGKRKDWIDSRLMVRVVLVVEGSPVWPMFRREVHVAREVLRPIPGAEVLVGLDFGRSPAAVFTQPVNNRILVQHELIGEGEGAVTFAPKVKRLLAEKYPNCPVRFYGDPKGADKTQTDERSAFDIFRGLGMPVLAPPGLKNNSISMRVDTVAYALNEMYDGSPRVRISPTCRTLIVGMAGRYFNERDDTGELKPTKGKYSHVCDAGQYVFIGLGEGRRMTGQVPIAEMKPMQVWKRRKSMRRVQA
jgi:tRNA A37 threonylcarbamoyladenosine biosynthesis protein TsaE